MQISQINLFHVYWLLFILAIWIIISKHQTCNFNYSIFTITKLASYDLLFPNRPELAKIIFTD